ncbi:hypothetical protein N0B31_03925 [Salinirubellus salinus]|uniref:Uncharacterized protein n=1 Tax=Salinirubellus salinus TaxID=1364945 RepID=A0A9E7R4P9_9EURY|nr:hypothetical protein [Salinirubellus salinus]UWM55436.1 hypothetical protein N0B31_03925 [Salinirubellus salinus]
MYGADERTRRLEARTVTGDDPDPRASAGPDLGSEEVTLRDLDAGPLVVGTFVGLAGLFFLVEPVVDPVAVGGLEVRMVGLSALSLVVGLNLGAAVFLSRGERLVGLAHGVAGVGFGAFLLGLAVGSGTLLLAGVLVVVGGMLALAAQSRNLV